MAEALDNAGVQGTVEPDRVLLDAAAVCGHLLAVGSVHGLLAEHRSRLFPGEMFGDLFGSGIVRFDNPQTRDN